MVAGAAVKQTMGSENAKYLYECKAKEPKNERYTLMRASLADILYLLGSFVEKIMGSMAHVPSRDETMKEKKISDKMEHTN